VRFGAAIAFSVVCVLLLLPGAADAKGGGGSRGGSGGRSFASKSPPTRHVHRPHPVHQQPKPKHKHKHKHKNDGDMDIDGGDGEGGEGAEAEGADAGEAAGAGSGGEAAAVEVAVYGMEITALYKGAAAKSGLGVGDIIMKVNGTATPTFEALSQALAQSGGRARVVVIREGDESETVTLYPLNGLIGVSVEPARVE
jgi:membrane-associated protease RseP (regulator of RpoE activity)